MLKYRLDQGKCSTKDMSTSQLSTQSLFSPWQHRQHAGKVAALSRDDRWQPSLRLYRALRLPLQEIRAAGTSCKPSPRTHAHHLCCSSPCTPILPAPTTWPHGTTTDSVWSNRTLSASNPCSGRRIWRYEMLSLKNYRFWVIIGIAKPTTMPPTSFCIFLGSHIVVGPPLEQRRFQALRSEKKQNQNKTIKILLIQIIAGQSPFLCLSYALLCLELLLCHCDGRIRC